MFVYIYSYIHIHIHVCIAHVNACICMYTYSMLAWVVSHCVSSYQLVEVDYGLMKETLAPRCS